MSEIRTREELYHYGVVGMKWGVRRGNAGKAYAKASKKLAKIDKKYQKQLSKFHKKAEKAESSRFNVDSKRRKAQKAAGKLVRTSSKGKKWVSSMERAFKGTPNQLSKDQIALGRKYSDFLTSRYNSRY